MRERADYHEYRVVVEDRFSDEKTGKGECAYKCINYQRSI